MTLVVCGAKLKVNQVTRDFSQPLHSTSFVSSLFLIFTGIAA